MPADIRAITERVRRAVPPVDILVTDDSSPDGTGAIADELALADDHIFVLHRAGKDGLGAAYKAGFAWAKDKASIRRDERAQQRLQHRGQVAALAGLRGHARKIPIGR